MSLALEMRKLRSFFAAWFDTRRETQAERTSEADKEAARLKLAAEAEAMRVRIANLKTALSVERRHE